MNKALWASRWSSVRFANIFVPTVKVGSGTGFGVPEVLLVLDFKNSYHRSVKTVEPEWRVPGGKVEFGETVQEAIRREFFEETGCKLLRPDIFLDRNLTQAGVHEKVLFLGGISHRRRLAPPTEFRTDEVVCARYFPITRLPAPDSFASLGCKMDVYNLRRLIHCIRLHQDIIEEGGFGPEFRLLA